MPLNGFGVLGQSYSHHSAAKQQVAFTKCISAFCRTLKERQKWRGRKPFKHYLTGGEIKLKDGWPRKGEPVS